MAILCTTCGAALPVDLRSRHVRCASCQSNSVIPAAQVLAVRVHLERLTRLARAADEAAGESDYQRRRLRFQPGAVLMFFAPLLVSWWIVAGLGVGVGAMFGVFALVPHLESNQVLGALVALGGMLIWAGWVAVLRLFLTRRREVMAALPATATPASCSRCGATVPVLVGLAMHCPFCTAELLPDRTARGSAEAAAQREVTHLRAQAVIAAAHAETSRVPALENLITMTTFAQLATIGLSCVISIVVVAIAIVKALR
jgi:DNA-directed RNA polymerase subunit RPC12/RpoP